MISLFTYPQFPPQGLAQVDGSGKLLTSLYYLLQAIYKRTGNNSGVTWTVGSGLTATGVSQTLALQLNDDYNEVTGGSGLGVMLHQLQPGQQQWVFNGNGGNINVYPIIGGGQIDALLVNAPYVLGNGKTQIFTCPKLLASGASFYRSTQLG